MLVITKCLATNKHHLGQGWSGAACSKTPSCSTSTEECFCECFHLYCNIQSDFPVLGLRECIHLGVCQFSISCLSQAQGRRIFTAAGDERSAYLILRLCVQEDGRLTWDNERITCSQPCSSSVQGGWQMVENHRVRKGPKTQCCTSPVQWGCSPMQQPQAEPGSWHV